MSVNTEAARKAVPGLEEAYAVHQLSEKNNTRTLTQKFNSDLTQTTSAMKEVTISGAAVATRSAKVVGHTLVSRTKLAKASKKMLVHTGALGVKTGRAVKGVMNEMVDAADKKGKYQPKVRPFVPYDGHPQAQVLGQVHAYEYQQQQQADIAQPPAAQPLPNPMPAAAPVPSKIPARKPVRPLSVSLNPSFSNQTSINVQASINPSVSMPSTTSAGMPTVAPAPGQVSQSTNSAVTEENDGAINAPPVATQSFQPHQTSHSTASTQGAQATQEETSIHSAVPVQQQPPQTAPAPPTTAAGLPGLTGVQPGAAIQPSTAAPQQQSNPMISVQAQGPLTIDASISPPSYAQATGQPASTSGAGTARPPRRPLPQSAITRPQRPVAERPSGNPGTTVNQPSAAQYATCQLGQTIYQYQNQQVTYADQGMYASIQPMILASNPQPVVIEQNQTIIQQTPAEQDPMFAAMQMQMTQQSATDQLLLLQQNADTQNMMLAQAQMASAQQQQPVYVEETFYVDQSQNVEVCNVEEDNMTAYTAYTDYTDYGGTAEVVSYTDAMYGEGEAYATGTAGDEVVYIEEDATAVAGGSYAVDYQAEAMGTGEMYEADVGVDEGQTELCV
ncbi:hypothetical protein A1O7_08459 [Cladophialophora yegresii CBS 114405]|uniref:Uncharacterized protein n=1 Tax=Cladophialophora yegresii CBS 114405 TaxID=1182544 RepID=W9VTP0_9EURO|nr:uncharacterized protein A1O7_08459 [Cladophialophora yegresii CBS 114405]EXJ55531.1 hypothetical protein A1O7_08459 [Cladophialophora yegresii CBS 114405]